MKKRFYQRYLIIPAEIIFLVLAVYNLAFSNKIFPGVWVNGLNLGGKTPAVAAKLLADEMKIPEKITLRSETQDFEINLSDISFSWNPETTAKTAYEYHRTGNIFIDLQREFVSLVEKTRLSPIISFDEQKLSQNLAVTAALVTTDPVYPELKIKLGKIWVEKGKPGNEVDLKNLRLAIGQNLSSLSGDPILIPLVKIDPTLSANEAETFRVRGENLLNKSLSLKYDLYTYYLPGKDLIKYLQAGGEYKDKEVDSLIEKVSTELNRKPQDSVFVFTGNQVQEFTPAKDGIEANQESLKNMIIGNLRSLENQEEKSISLEIPVTLAPPMIKTGDVNNLGIKELLGRGVSYFRGSIPGRIHNISLASLKFKGILIAPGEVFSFNKTLGDVSALTGYKQAYIIKDGRTILGDGGGVCQVSSTLFRAALNAGLPILERKAHSYRVSYYEQSSPVGLDATVYDPTADLKFKNDTPAHILIQPQFNPKNSQLIFEIYGTDDSRISKLSKPTVTDLVAPSEDLYQDDPSLPVGTLKQIDWKAWGAKVTYVYTVVRAGETIYKKTFVSNYQPWQAVYLRGTGQSVN